ncbi:MAG: hypothetical protein R3E86_21490 [Pseudomonadales bacterium]
MHRRVLIVLASLTALTGCTLQHIEQSTLSGLEWVHLRNGVAIGANTRWRLPPGSTVSVAELAAADDPAWLDAAKTGVESVFVPPAAAGAESHPPFRLLVSWPGEHPQTAQDKRDSLWHPLNPGRLLAGPVDPLAIEVAVLDPYDGRLVQSARLALSPHWLATPSSRTEHIERAFRELAAALYSG